MMQRIAPRESELFADANDVSNLPCREAGRIQEYADTLHGIARIECRMLDVPCGAEFQYD